MRYLAIALLVVLLVATAGCSGLVGTDSQPSETTTAAPTTDTTTESTTETTDQTPEQLAPGLTSEGVTDALALAEAHRGALTKSTFVKQKNITETNDTATITQQTTFTYVNDSHWEKTVTADGMPVALDVDNGTWTAYTDGEAIVYRLQGPNDTRYGVANWVHDIGALVPPEQYIQGTSLDLEGVFNREFVYSLFGSSDVTVEDASGETIELTGAAEKLSIDGNPATDVEFTATVTEDGLVESIHLTYEQDGTAVERSVMYDTSVSEPLTRPDWYETAVEESPVNETAS